MDNSDLDKKVGTQAKKAELKAEQSKILKIQAFDSSYIRGKSNFEDNGTQNYLVFQSVLRYFKQIANSYNILLWKSKGLNPKVLNLQLHLILISLPY